MMGSIQRVNVDQADTIRARKGIEGSTLHVPHETEIEILRFYCGFHLEVILFKGKRLDISTLDLTGLTKGCFASYSSSEK
jgi:hypothetical protein